MISVTRVAPTTFPCKVPQIRWRNPRHLLLVNRTVVCCTKPTPWDSSPLTYAPTKDSMDDDNLFSKTSNLFETLSSNDQRAVTDSEAVTSRSPLLVRFPFLKWPMWILGPGFLLATGIVPTLWLPLSSVFLGPNIASLLSLTGLDCVFNLGTTLFLLMADSCSRPEQYSMSGENRPTSCYKLWNVVASLSGLVIPLTMFFSGFVEPQLPFISFAVLLGPYLLLLCVQLLTEALTWHWQSPVWMVTPVVYEGYRVLQLMRGLKIAGEISVPTWTLHLIRGLVSWWILILGIQLMSLAWFAGFASARKQKSASHSVSAHVDG